jgi:hypothetical protein
LIEKERTGLIYPNIPALLLAAVHLMGKEGIDFRDGISMHSATHCCLMLSDYALECCLRPFEEDIIDQCVVRCDLDIKLDAIPPQLLIGSHIVVKWKLISSNYSLLTFLGVHHQA